VLSTPDAELQLAGPTACELVDPDAEGRLRARLGPDPLRDDPEPAFAALRRRRAGIGQVLLDQTVIAAFGNVHRAELLFRLRIDPDRAAGTVDRATFDELWRLLRGLLTDGERRGRISRSHPRTVRGRRRDCAATNACTSTDAPGCLSTVRHADRSWKLGAYACPVSGRMRASAGWAVSLGVRKAASVRSA